MIKYFKRGMSFIKKMILSDDYHCVLKYYGKSSGKQPDIRQNVPFGKLAEKVIEDKNTSLYYERLYSIFNSLENLRLRLKTDDEIVCAEVGVYKGGGSYFISSVLETLGFKKYKLYSIDTFEGHSELDFLKEKTEGVHEAGLFYETSFETVSKYLSKYQNIEVLKGRIQDKADMIKDFKFSFVHLDMDIYQPTVFALDFFSSRIIIGGIVILDDYEFQTCPGIKKAIDEFLATNKNFVQVPLLSGQCQLIKISE